MLFSKKFKRQHLLDLCEALLLREPLEDLLRAGEPLASGEWCVTAREAVPGAFAPGGALGGLEGTA